MNVGTIAYSVESGLGLLAKAFVDAGLINRVLPVRHPHYTHCEGMYSPDLLYQDPERFLAGLDVLWLFENAFRWNVAQRAKQLGIPIVIMPMYEYTPMPLPVPADLVICPSLLDLQYYDGRDVPAVYLPVPVSIPWRLRTRARVWVHNAGHAGRGYRNGTPELLKAMRYVKSPIRLLLRGQPDDSKINVLFNSVPNDPRIQVTKAHVPWHQLWTEGDVFIFPEKFNGLSLPLQEARACGMLVMASNRFPINTWLPPEPLIPVDHYERDHIAVDITRAVITPQEIARTIDAWYDRDITGYSLSGRDWALSMNWDTLKPRYVDALENLLCQSS